MPKVRYHTCACKAGNVGQKNYSAKCIFCGVLSQLTIPFTKFVDHRLVGVMGNAPFHLSFVCPKTNADIATQLFMSLPLSMSLSINDNNFFEDLMGRPEMRS